jgi:curved DNA-binding protein CbpA
MRTQRNYYEILGLQRTATIQEIKKRYRELARKYHPDVHRDKELAQRAFVQIVEAYKTLSDAMARRQYDESLGRPTTTPGAPTRRSGPGQSARPRITEAQRLIGEAQLAFVRGRFSEAAIRCRQALRSNPNLARAHAILGDINRIQNRTEPAIVEYGFAVQLDPNDRESRRKLERLVRGEATAMRRESRIPLTRAVSVELLLGNMIGWGIAFFLLLLIYVFPGNPIAGFREYLPALSKWSGNLIFFLAADGALVGLLLSLNGMLGHPDDELMSQPVPVAARKAQSLPVGIVVLLLSVVFFYGAAAFYLLIAAFQEHVSRSVLWVFTAVAGITVVAALMYFPGRAQALLYGGNVVFLAMVAGWYLGEFLKPGV